MVTTPTATIMAVSNLVTWPKASPIVIRIRENSEIWARVTEVKKEVLFLYLNTPIMGSVTRGCPTRTKTEKTNVGTKIAPGLSTKSCPPRVKKNIVRKKSLKGRVLEAIPRCSGRLVKEQRA